MKQTVDLHGMTAEEAKKHLTKLLKTLPDRITELVVIHGYHRGDLLQQTIRGRGFRHKRVEKKIFSLNPGETSLILRPKSALQKEKNG